MERRENMKRRERRWEINGRRKQRVGEREEGNKGEMRTRGKK